MTLLSIFSTQEISMKIQQCLLAGLLFSTTLAAAAESSKTVTIYSERKEQLIKPILDEYTKETGVKIVFLSDSVATLTQRLKAEGSKSPADILLAVDAGSLWNAAQQDLFEPTQSAVLEANIPADLRDPQNKWFGLTIRARTMVYNPKKIQPSEIKSYANLATPAFKGRLCLRTSKKVYNQSLVGMLIADKGEAQAEKIVKGWVENLAAPVFADDNAVIAAVNAGQCDVGIVNSYYYGRLIKKDPKLTAKLFWAPASEGGVHVNISGAGILKTSKNKVEAKKLIEWMAGEKAQKLFTDIDFEFPVSSKVAANPVLQSWGKYDAAKGNIAKAGELQEKATKLMDRVNYK